MNRIPKPTIFIAVLLLACIPFHGCSKDTANRKNPPQHAAPNSNRHDKNKDSENNSKSDPGKSNTNETSSKNSNHNKATNNTTKSTGSSKSSTVENNSNKNVNPGKSNSSKNNTNHSKHSSVKSKQNSKEKTTVDPDPYGFIGVYWTRQSEVDTEYICFASDGTFHYYCACGDPVNDSDLCESYTYDEPSKTITLNYFETTESAITSIIVKRFDETHLVLDFNGDIRSFVKES